MRYSWLLRKRLRLLVVRNLSLLRKRTLLTFVKFGYYFRGTCYWWNLWSSYGSWWSWWLSDFDGYIARRFCFSSCRFTKRFGVPDGGLFWFPFFHFTVNSTVDAILLDAWHLSLKRQAWFSLSAFSEYAVLTPRTNLAIFYGPFFSPKSLEGFFRVNEQWMGLLKGPFTQFIWVNVFSWMLDGH